MGISGEYRYLSMEAGEGMMPLHLEWIDTDVIAVSHIYELNGDLMYDPEMTFRVDREKGTLEPLTFRQDGSFSLYQEVYPEPGKWIPKLSRDLSNFAQQWFKNISQQNYRKKEAVIERDGADVRLTFDRDGKTLEPAPDVPSEPDAKAPVSMDSPNRFEVSRLWGNNGPFGIWDNALERFYEEGNHVLQFVERGSAENYLANILRITGHELPPEPSAEWVVTPVTLYEKAYQILDRAVRTSSLYPHLRDRDLDYDGAANALNAEMPQLMEAARFNPDIMAAYQALPMFSEWLVEDILESYYQDVVIDQRLAPERYADSPDAPAWARKPPAVDNSEPEQAGGTEMPPAENPIPEVTVAGASDAAEKPDTAVWRTPGGIEYKMGNAVDYDFGDDAHGSSIIADIDEDYIYYIFPDFEQQPVSMPRDEFEGYLDNGEFTIADPTRTVEINELPTKADRVDYNPVDVAEPEMTPNVEQYLNLKAQ